MIAMRVRDGRDRHPEWWVALVSASVWVTMLAGVVTSVAGPGHDHTAPLRALGPWVLMVLAMMVPLTLPTVRGVARASLWPRRHRAVAVFLGGYVAVWAVAGVVLLEAHHVAEALLGPLPVASLALVTAVMWWRHPVCRRAAIRCGRSAPLAPRGWRADRDAARFGARIGASCVVSCWATMGAVVALGHHAVVMAAGLALHLHRRVRAA